jgi:sugar diacid utilization regulator
VIAFFFSFFQSNSLPHRTHSAPDLARSNEVFGLDLEQPEELILGDKQQNSPKKKNKKPKQKKSEVEKRLLQR